MTLWNTLLSFFLPEVCILCHTEGSSLCVSCLEQLPVCTHGPHDFIYPLFSYLDKKVHTVIHALKYNHVHSIIPIVTPILHDLIQDIITHSITLSSGPFYIIPVPDMKKHTRARGTNHVQKIAHSLTQYASCHYVLLDTAIIRTNEQSQRGLPRKERLINMKDAFAVVKPNILNGKTVIIVDDVCTTGSTLLELRDVCITHGAHRVYAVALAH